MWSPDGRPAERTLDHGGRSGRRERATFSGVNIFRFKKGKVAEVWNHRDDFGLMEQVGTRIHGGAIEGGEN